MLKILRSQRKSRKIATELLQSEKLADFRLWTLQRRILAWKMLWKSWWKMWGLLNLIFGCGKRTRKIHRIPLHFPWQIPRAMPWTFFTAALPADSPQRRKNQKSLLISKEKASKGSWSAPAAWARIVQGKRHVRTERVLFTWNQPWIVHEGAARGKEAYSHTPPSKQNFLHSRISQNYYYYPYRTITSENK